MDLTGNNEKLFGEFVGVTWEGVQAEHASDAGVDLGVKNVSLVD